MTLSYCTCTASIEQLLFAPTAASKQQKLYAGVVVFCVPYVLESGKDTESVDGTEFQVCIVMFTAYLGLCVFHVSIS